MGPAVHDGGDFPVMVVKNVLGGGCGGLPGDVGGGCGNGNPRKANDLPGHGVVRAATATVESPPVVRRGTQSRAGSTMVSGPGQNSFASS